MSHQAPIETPDQILLEPTETATACVIWLHGLGADGHDFVPIVPELTLSQPVRFVFPHAPERAVTINGGMEMRAWYDIDPQSPLAGTDDIRASSERLDALVQTQIDAGLPADRIVIAGFSQGGVIALQHGLRSTRGLAGILALSTCARPRTFGGRADPRQPEYAHSYGPRHPRPNDSHYPGNHRSGSAAGAEL